jgi:hypothetical protein
MHKNRSFVGSTFYKGTAGDHKGPPSHTSPPSPLRKEISPGRMESPLVLKLYAFCAGLLFILTACGATATQVVPQKTVTVSSGFQTQVSPIPTIPTYLCGAWSSNNAPGPNSTIIIFARITKNLAGVNGANASAVVHFQSGDQALDQHPTSDTGGYVSFQLPLQGRQPVGIPATVDVTFGFTGTTVHCTPAFFTPM